MKFLYTFILIFTFVLPALAQEPDWNVQAHDGDPFAYYQNNSNWEETVYLTPDGSGTVEKIYIFLTGENSGRDTIYISGDPAEGGYPPSIFVRQLNTYASFIIDYDGNPAWYELDVSEMNIKSSPIKPILIQHLIKSGGPFFLLDDTEQVSPYNSFINDVFKLVGNFMGISASITQGNYFAAMKINYDHETKPSPTLIDVTEEAGLVDSKGNPIRKEMASIADFNSDGWDDVIIGGSIYQNMRDGSFSLHSTPFAPTPKGTTWGDLDNDGNIDVFTVNGWGNDKIYWGNGDGSFAEETPAAVVFDQSTVTPLFLDYDSDGLLDIYIAFGRKEVNGNETYYPDKLLRNLGNREFEDVTESAGIAPAEEGNPRDTWGASVSDFNGDGLPDIFVANYRLQADFLFENIGEGEFYEAATEYGVHGVPTAVDYFFGHGMGSDWGDYDNDGDQDLAVGNLAHWDSRGLYSNRSLILRNDWNDFTDVTAQMQLGFYEMNAGIMWVDLNNDSWLDIVHGQISYDRKGDGIDRLSRVYLNRGPDFDFLLEDISWEAGVDQHGAWCPIRFDYDKDGDMDFILASNQEHLKLYKNELGQEGAFLNFNLRGSPENGVNEDALGSKIEVSHEGQTITRWLAGTVHNGRASQSTNILHFGIPTESETVESVKFTFSNGETFELKDMALNQNYIINYDLLKDPEAPLSPELLSPNNEQVITNATITFEWEDIANATNYKIQFSKDASFNSFIASYTTIRNSFTLNSTFDNGDYYWRVNAGNLYGESDWSESRMITLDIESSVADLVLDHSDMKLYPIPAENELNIHLQNANIHSANVAIYDILGNKVKEYSDMKFSGLNSVFKSNISDLNSGLYYIVLETADISIRKRFMIAK